MVRTSLVAGHCLATRWRQEACASMGHQMHSILGRQYQPRALLPVEKRGCPRCERSEIYLVKSKQKPACAHGENSGSLRWGLEGTGP